MIKNKKDLKEFLDADKKQLGIKRRYPKPFTDEIWRYEIILRKYEYWFNKNSVLAKFMKTLYRLYHHRYSIKLGIGIGPNCCGKGLSIAHINGIQINGNAKCGENLRIHECVTIGASAGPAPVIGNNVFLASGCKIIGNVQIADNCVVGANAVVVKSIFESGITVGGVPAKKLNNHNSDRFIYWYNNGKPC